MASVEELLTEIRDLLKKEVPEGKAYNAEILVSTLQPPNPYSVPLPALMDLDIINDGPSTVQFRMPDSSECAWQDLLVTEVKTFTFNQRVIKSLGLRVATGGASVRLIGSF